MKTLKNVLLWFFVIIITLFFFFLQRLTGPTYPFSGDIKVSKKVHINYKMLRSDTNEEDSKIKIKDYGKIDEAYLYFRRHKTKDKWKKVRFKRSNNNIVAFLPAQPPAGKLDYYVNLYVDGIKKRIPEQKKFITIRFKGKVPAVFLLIHVVFMFFSLLFSVRAFFEAFRKDKKYLKKYVKLTFWTLVIGGFLFGGIVQTYAFGTFWAGIPFGFDLTDNKTLIAFIGWLIALLKTNRDEEQGRKWVIGVFVLMSIIYLVPHSTLGSSLDYSKMENINKEETFERTKKSVSDSGFNNRKPEN